MSWIQWFMLACNALTVICIGISVYHSNEIRKITVQMKKDRYHD